eukprot:IDg21539t1
MTMTHTTSNADLNMMAVMWVDRNRCYFISTTCTSISMSDTYRERWQRTESGSQRVTLQVTILEVAKTYYSACSIINRHNRCRQDDLGLELKFEVKECPDFYSKLAEELIDNKYDGVSTRLVNPDNVSPSYMSTMSGIGAHLTPTSKKRKLQDGTLTNSAMQGGVRFAVPRNRSFTCSACSASKACEHWVCHSGTGRDCFRKHVTDTHQG